MVRTCWTRSVESVGRPHGSGTWRTSACGPSDGASGFGVCPSRPNPFGSNSPHPTEAGGPVADTWLDIAQAFAGPPGRGRPLRPVLRGPRGRESAPDVEGTP